MFDLRPYIIKSYSS